jgi:arylsulfatase A-like enzyme
MFSRPYDGSVDGSTLQLRRFREGEFPLDGEDVHHLVDLYVAGIRQVDEEIKRLLRYLEEKGLDEKTLIVLTSDHGEEFLEHDGVLHGRTQYQEVLRVPLIFSGPGVPQGLRITEPVSLVDVAPTVTSLLGVSFPAVDGTDFSSLWKGKDGEGETELYIFSEADHNNEDEDMFRSVRQGQFKLIVDRRTGEKEMYNLDEDPGETENIADEQPKIRQRLIERLEEHLDESMPKQELPDLSSEEREHLESLGYFD